MAFWLRWSPLQNANRSDTFWPPVTQGRHHRSTKPRIEGREEYHSSVCRCKRDQWGGWLCAWLFRARGYVEPRINLYCRRSEERDHLLERDGPSGRLSWYVKIIDNSCFVIWQDVKLGSSNSDALPKRRFSTYTGSSPMEWRSSS